MTRKLPKKLTSIALTIFVVGAVFTFLFSYTRPKNDEAIITSSVEKDLSSKIEIVMDESLKSLSGLVVNSYVTQVQTDTPGKTQKTDQNNTFLVTIQSPYFVHDNKTDKDFLKKVLIHEMMHVISLQNNQFNNLTAENFDPSDRLKYDKAELKCSPNYFNSHGCFKADSYLSTFYSRFWTGDFKTEYDKIQQETDKATFTNSLISWGENNQDKFVSKNAFIDLAESFSFWALGLNLENPTQTQMKKINFFNSYPELKAVKDSYLNTFDKKFE
jgi:hypothetical protein